MNITRFKGEHGWLSNFAPVQVVLDGQDYASVEHAYQAAKSIDPAERSKVRRCSHPGAAKRVGRRLVQREDWDQIKDAVMLDLLRQKFAHQNMSVRLLETGDAELIEGNSWGDTYWGVSRGVGLNKLGQLLMQVRDELRSLT